MRQCVGRCLVAGWAACVLSAALAEAAAPIAPEVANLWNLLKNPGFEQGDTQPAHWGRYPRRDDGGNRQLRDTQLAHSGKTSGLIWSVTPYPAGKPWMQWSQYGVPVEGGSAAIVSFWTRTEGVAHAHAGIHLYDKDGGHLGFTPIRVPQAARQGTWVYIRQKVPLHEAAAKMGFVLYARETGKTWYDDVACIGTPSAVAVRATPKLDGRLDEPCWADARAIRSFARHTGTGLPTEKTRAWLAFDDDCLYVAFDCPHPRGARLRAKAAEHDGETWLDDSIEVFLDPRHRHTDYFQLCVNCRGVVRDSHRIETAWESGARAAVARRDDAWSVELAIPYDRLGLTLDTGTLWGINLVRNDRVRGETATWSLGGFHEPGRFGNVSLTPDLTRVCRPDLARRMAELDVRRRRLAAEIRGAELPPKALAEATELLSEAGALLAPLRPLAEGRAERTRRDWPDVQRTLAAASRKLVEAKRTALGGLFTLQGGGEQGFRVAIAHSLQKVRRAGPVADGQLTRRVRLELARDESESFQLVVLPTGRALQGLAIQTAPLRFVGAAPPHADTPRLTWHRVGYVETARPKYRVAHVGWWPDPLLPPGPFDLTPGQRQPLWFTVTAPPGARPGLYRGQVAIRHGRRELAVPVEVRVRNFRLPRPGTLATAFGLYAQVLARWYYGNAPYRDKMPIESFVRFCRFLGEYRLTPKNIAREYITVAREKGRYTADLSALSQTVAPLAPRYFAPDSFCLHRLPVSSVLRRGNQAHDTDAWAAITKAIAEAWERRHLPRHAYIYGMDEPRAEDLAFLAALYRKVRRAAPGFPIMQTIGHPDPHELVGLVDIWCPLTPRLVSPFYARRRKAGDTLWTYVCCGPVPPYANFFVDQPATAHRVLFWQVRQAGATGLLYWCVCYWNGLPNAASGKPCFPDVPIRFKDLGTYRSYKVNGDGVLLYPGPGMTPYPSIRLEVIRDGIEDYEYLALLDGLVGQAEALPPRRRPAAGTLATARELCRVPQTISRTLTDYTDEPAHIFARRRQVGDMIQRLTDLLGAAHNAARKHPPASQEE